MDQNGDTQPSAVTGLRADAQSSTTSRFVSLSQLLSANSSSLFFSKSFCPLSGLEHYDDLNQSVTKAEADAIGEIVERAVLSILPGAQITLIGGFRR